MSFDPPGLQTEGRLHGLPGSPATHAGGLLEDDLGVEELLYRDAN